MNTPRGLRPGNTIGVVAPAAAMPETDLERTARVVTALGYNVQIAPHASRRESYFGAKPEERAQELESMFLDPDIDGIMCVKGGYGSMEIVELLDYETISSHRKVFIGYSDITVLLIALLERSHFSTFHGPMLHSFLSGADQFSLINLHNVLSGAALDVTLFEAPEELMVLRPGTGEGRLIGGNLTLLSYLIGTAYDFDTSDCILFVEDIDEDLYRIERSLLHLRLAGKLSQLRGLIIGDMVDVRPGKIPLGKNLAEIVRGVCGDTPYPIVMGFPCGHGARQMTLPLGVRARIAVEGHAVQFALMERPVSFD